MESVLNRVVIAITAVCAIIGAPLVPASAAPPVGLAASSTSASRWPTASSDADEFVDVLASVSTRTSDLQDVDPASAATSLAPGSPSSESMLLSQAAEASVPAAGQNPLTVDLQAVHDAVEVSVAETDIEVIDNGDGSTHEAVDGSTTTQTVDQRG